MKLTRYDKMSKDDNGNLELFAEWGGENTTYRLYAREKEEGFLSQLGKIENPKANIGSHPNLLKKCAEVVLVQTGIVSKGEKIPYVLVHFTWGYREYGTLKSQ